MRIIQPKGKKVKRVRKVKTIQLKDKKVTIIQPKDKKVRLVQIILQRVKRVNRALQQSKMRIHQLIVILFLLTHLVLPLLKLMIIIDFRLDQVMVHFVLQVI